MTHFARLLAAAAALGCMAGPAAAQYGQPYPPYPPSGYPPYNNYPGQPYPGYPGYGSGGGIIGNIIDNLIGNRWNVSDRQAIRSCAYAAVQRAENEYRPYFGGGMPYAYQGYNGYVRVSAITDVSRRSNGVRVRGLLDTARGGYNGGGYGDLEFRCDVDYRGYVYNLRLNRTSYWRF
jgi:opacity protein-like surface antigen